MPNIKLSSYDKILIIKLDKNCHVKTHILQYNTPVYLVHLQFDSTGSLLDLSHRDKAKFNTLTGTSKIYIEGHGSKDSPDYIANSNNNTLTAQKLAEIIFNNVIPNQINGLTISLHVCEAGNFSSNTCFALILYKNLIRLGLHEIKIIANTLNVYSILTPLGSVYNYSAGLLESDLEKKIQRLTNYENKLFYLNKIISVLLNRIYCARAPNSAVLFYSICCSALYQVSQEISYDRNILTVELDKCIQQIKILNRMDPFRKIVLTVNEHDEPVIFNQRFYKNWVFNTSSRLPNPTCTDDFLRIKLFKHQFFYLTMLSFQNEYSKIATEALKEIQHFEVKIQLS